MKCVVYSNGRIDRVMDQEAYALVREGKATFTNKTNWKNFKRPKPQPKAPVEPKPELSSDVKVVTPDIKKTKTTVKNKKPKKV